jgi:hypothetical protein
MRPVIQYEPAYTMCGRLYSVSPPVQCAPAYTVRRAYTVCGRLYSVSPPVQCAPAYTMRAGLFGVGPYVECGAPYSGVSGCRAAAYTVCFITISRGTALDRYGR